MRRFAVLLVLAALLAPATASAAPARDTEPVVLTGADLPAGWAVPASATAQLPLMDLAPQEDEHNDYADPLLDTGDVTPGGTPTDRLL
ncbi:MAG: hypothetical protein HZB46_12605, partial [Solirubrobacterales bacterium]|nr:hypothetical protein [Solirubrobacterales bacterium]